MGVESCWWIRSRGSLTSIRKKYRNRYVGMLGRQFPLKSCGRDRGGLAWAAITFRGPQFRWIIFSCMEVVQSGMVCRVAWKPEMG